MLYSNAVGRVYITHVYKRTKRCAKYKFRAGGIWRKHNKSYCFEGGHGRRSEVAVKNVLISGIYTPPITTHLLTHLNCKLVVTQ